MEITASPLTPQLVQQIVDQEESVLRCHKSPPETVKKILKYGGTIGSRIEHHARLTRGMDRARILIHEAEEANRSFASGTVIVADELESGKGRFTRPWHAPKGGIWLTLILVNTLLPESGRLYPLAAGVACCETLRHYGIEAHVKWVNDIQVTGRKIAGILTETMIGPRYGEEYILVGLGINVNNDTFPPELAELAVSVKNLLNKELAVEQVTARLLAKLAWNIGLLHYEEERLLEEKDGEPTTGGHPLLDRWRELSDIAGRRVLFGYDVQKNPQYEARVKGLDDSGALILELDDGSITIEYSGEITYLD